MNDASDEKHPDIAEAIKIAGSQVELAKRCNTRQQTISKLLKREIAVSAEVAKKIDSATSGIVPCWKLRPDLWEPPSQESSSYERCRDLPVAASVPVQSERA